MARTAGRAGLSRKPIRAKNPSPSTPSRGSALGSRRTGGPTALMTRAQRRRAPAKAYAQSIRAGRKPRATFHATTRTVVASRVAKARGGRPGGGGGYSGSTVSGTGPLTVTLALSANTVRRRIGPQYIGQATLDRWATIRAGGIPEGEEPCPPPMDEDALNEAESEALADIEQAARQFAQRNEDSLAEVLADLDAQRARITGRMEDGDYDWGEDGAYQRRQDEARLDDLDSEERQAIRKARAEAEKVGEEVREARENARRELQRQQEQREDEWEATRTRLQAGLTAEITEAVRTRYLHGQDVTVEDWEL